MGKRIISVNGNSALTFFKNMKKNYAYFYYKELVETHIFTSALHRLHTDFLPRPDHLILSAPPGPRNPPCTSLSSSVQRHILRAYETV